MLSLVQSYQMFLEPQEKLHDRLIVQGYEDASDIESSIHGRMAKNYNEEIELLQTIP